MDQRGSFCKRKVYVLTIVGFYVDISEETLKAVQTLVGDEAHDWSYFSAVQLQLMKMLFASARLYNPQCRLVLLTDQATVLDRVALPSDVEVFRFSIDEKQFMLARLIAECQFLEQERGGGPFLFLDSDMLIQASLERLQESSFDVAVTIRNHFFPVNGGFLAVGKEASERASLFLKKIAHFLEALPAHLQPFRSVQHAFKTVVEPLVAREGVPNPDKPRFFRIDNSRLMLLADSYNLAYPKELSERGSVVFQEGAKIVHFHGARKPIMEAYYEQFLLSKYQGSPSHE